MGNGFLSIQSISKKFPPDAVALDHVSLSISQSEIICLLGPSGCGKTTLLRIVGGLSSPDSGDIMLDGKVITNLAPHKREFGMMFQDYALFPHKNVYENVAFGLKMQGMSNATIRRRVEEMLSIVNMNNYWDRRIDQLSGGEQQRVALARSLAPQPRLLMLDEPLAALDRTLRDRLMRQLRSILTNVGVTAIYVTHDQTEAYAIADRIVVMNSGNIEQVDEPRALFSYPASPTVARFLGYQNLLPCRQGKEESRRLLTAIGSFESRTIDMSGFGPKLLLLKPDAVRDYKVVNGENGVTDQNDVANTIVATVTEVTFRGRFLQLRCHSIQDSNLEHELLFDIEPANIQEGEKILLNINPQKILTYG